MARRGNLFVLLFVAGLVAASLAVIATKRTQLGLDLRGGVELIYQGRPTPQQPEVTPEAIDRAIEIIRDRVDTFGVAEPEIARLGSDQITVGLPDVTNADRAADQVGTTAQLYFYDWEPNLIGPARAVATNVLSPPRDVLRQLEQTWREAGRNPAEPLNQQLITQGALPTVYEAVQLAADQPRVDPCPDCTADERFYLFERDPPHRLIAGPETARRDLFITPTGERRSREGLVMRVPQGTIVVSEQPVDPNTGETVPEEQHDPGWYVLRDRPALSGSDIRNPEQNFDPTTNQPNVTFDFTDQGREEFHNVTRQIALRGAANALPGTNPSDVSGHFAVVLDNEVVTRPIINFQENPDGIDGRTGAQISGGFTAQEAQDVANFLRIGALPIELKLISQSEVSAELGEQALDEGLKAGMVGLALVIIFLIAYYRFLGIVATIGLGVFALFFFALIKLIPITLTLPGIAGLILTIGVAADSNIVIFERIKEEVRSGRSLGSAIAAGYRRGIATIIDANVITLLTAFILFVLATAGVKGFAFTLGVGTIVSLFTAVVFTQAFLGIFGRGRVLRSRWLLGAGEQRARWHFDFTGLSRWFFSFSGLILAVGALALSTNQLNFGIDFESGTRLTATFEEPTEEEEVRAALDQANVPDAEVQQVEDPVFGANTFRIEAQQLQPEEVGSARAALQERFGVVSGSFESTSVGPTFGEQVARSAAYAIIFSLLLISAYVALRFEAKYAVPVLIAVAHDILITAGVYSLSEREVSSATVAAFLTILGYSLYDCIIVFDRVRENVPRMPRATFSQVVNRSMSEVLTRSLITGLSAVFLVTVLLIFGGETLKDFAFAMMVGIFSGTYSSIFIASPVLTAWKEREPGYQARRQRIERALGEVPAFAEDMEVARLGEDGEAPEEPAAPAGAAVPVEPAPEAAADEPVADERAAPAGTATEEPADEPRQGSEQQRRRRDKNRRRQRRRKHGRHR